MAIVRHKKTNIPYRYLGNNKFKNIHTEVEGEVSDEMAPKVFNINLDATAIFGKYPMVEKLCNKLKLLINN